MLEEFGIAGVRVIGGVQIRRALYGRARPVHLHRALDLAGVQAEARAEVERRFGLGRLALVPGERELAPQLGVFHRIGLGVDGVVHRVVPEPALVLVRRGGVLEVLALGGEFDVEVALVLLGVGDAPGGEALAAAHGHIAVHVVAVDLAGVDLQEVDVEQLLRHLDRRAADHLGFRRFLVLVLVAPGLDLQVQLIVVVLDLKVEGAELVAQ